MFNEETNLNSSDTSSFKLNDSSGNIDSDTTTQTGNRFNDNETITSTCDDNTGLTRATITTSLNEGTGCNASEQG